MKIKVNGDRALVYTPYNRDFVSRIKSSVGGSRWDAEARAWSIPSASADAVREIMRSVYGEDDRPETVDRVSVRLSFASDLYIPCGDVTLLGKCIAHANGRDSGARPGDGVAFVVGSPVSGGSAKNWYSCVPAGSVVVLSGVPRALLGEVLPASVTAEVIEHAGIDREALESERAKLLARIAEIDRLLA